jgi:hypothetical protein
MDAPNPSRQPPPSPHVFISYARDGAAGDDWAARIQQRLQGLGIPCWRDTGVEPDQAWSDRIPAAIEAAGVLVCVVSRATRDRDWVHRELTFALARRKPILPVLVDPEAELPFEVCNQPPLDLADPDAWGRLERRCGDLLGLGVAPGRQAETAYLHRLLIEHELGQVERLYTPLPGERRNFEGLARILRQALIPVTLRLERCDDRQVDGNECAADRADTPAQIRGEHFDDALEALGASPRLVVLGEPGAGKTFSLWRLAARLARAALDGPSPSDPRPPPIPILIPLGDWIAPDEPLETFIRRQLGDLGELLDVLRAKGRLALLLDGLNELPTAQRADKAEQIRRLAADPRLARVVATCRERDFVGELRLDLDRLTIQPLDPPRVHRFLRAYLGALDPAHGTDRADALFWHLARGDEVRELYQALGLDLSQLRGVAEPPAAPEPPGPPWPALGWLQRSLPWRRRRMSRVYTESVLANWRPQWEEVLRAAAGDNPRSLLGLAEKPYLLAMMVGLYLQLGPLALRDNRVALFQAFVADLLEREDQRHQAANGAAAHPGRMGVENGLGALAWRLQSQAGGAENVQLALPRREAEALLTPDQLRLAQGASLLEVRELVRFTHQLLQEYFAAIGLREGVPIGRPSAADLWPPVRWWQRSGWEEAAVLLAGLFGEDCTLVIRWLKDAQPEVAAQCLETSGATVADHPALLPELHDAWLPRLTNCARDPAPEARAAIGRALGRLGLDDRKGVGLTADGLPDIDWVEIPPGGFLYGEAKEQCSTVGFRIARYPVTHAQYQAFLDAPDGYADDRWWRGLTSPNRAPEAARWPIPNHPRETVSWHEPMAYCAWLSNRTGLAIRLPTEIEWERAARGTDGREYPWGESYVAGYANIDETRKGEMVGPNFPQQTTAVGIYPQGGSPGGILDLAGNVWEWCLNEYINPETMAGALGSRTLRGGSWNNNRHNARGQPQRQPS